MADAPGHDARRRDQIAAAKRRGRLYAAVGAALLVTAGALLAGGNEAWRPVVLLGGLAVVAGFVLVRFPG